MQKQPTPLKPEPRVDIGALASGFQLETATRTATALVHAISALDDAGEPLNELQKIQLVESALRHFDGTEIAFAKELHDDLGRSGVPTWGLPDEIDYLVDPS